jgi:hypothetical protein
VVFGKNVKRKRLVTVQGSFSQSWHTKATDSHPINRLSSYEKTISLHGTDAVPSENRQTFRPGSTP